MNFSIFSPCIIAFIPLEIAIIDLKVVHMPNHLCQKELASASSIFCHYCDNAFAAPMKQTIS